MIPYLLADAAETAAEVVEKAPGVTMEAANLQLLGVIVVFTCLISLAVVVWLNGKFFIYLDNKKKAAAAAAASTSTAPSSAAPVAAAPASAQSNGLTPELVAVIAAAVDSALDGRGHRILDIRQSAQSPWAISGRTDIFASHRLRK